MTLLASAVYLAGLAGLIAARKSLMKPESKCTETTLCGHAYTTCFGVGDGEFHRWACPACREGAK